MELNRDQLIAAWRQIADAVAQAVATIQRFLADVVRLVVRIYRGLQRARLIPRQYREMIMRRKLRALRR